MLNRDSANYFNTPFGRKKSVNGTITRYIYDNEDILFEYNNAGVLEARYTHGLGVDAPLSMERAGQLKGLARYRVGEWRVIYRVDKEKKVVEIIAILP
ncbi:MAG: type II toxin-antitoxin system RelE/ParE family toxin [Dissulfurispiraceae bacterium]|jgi:hypothetical protein|nr:type II toxin-antitoxin system RelE/ParE family toxin [Dissulfurispiraceae bacterium]